MKWLRPAPKRGVSTNIYENMVTRNVVEPAYVANAIGDSISVQPEGRKVPGPILRGAGPQASLPPAKRMTDRLAPVK